MDKYIGDAVMALFPEKAADALDAAVDMQRELREFNHHRIKKNFEPVKIGVGLHSGSLYLGTIGEAERMDSTVISDTVNVASRIEHLTKTVGASVLVSGAMFSQIADSGRFHARLLGRIPLRGKKEKMEIFEIFDGQSDYLLDLFVQTIADFNKGVAAFYAHDFQTATAAFVRVLALNPADRVSQLYQTRASQRLA
ncbi:MAG: adenylate/guanylate cyclase domain-containing protein [Turneriella sp.]